MTQNAKRHLHLTTLELYRLDRAALVVTAAFGTLSTYLVGSANERADYRDVDVRTILPDEEFDELFGSRQPLWELICVGTSIWLSANSGLPVDYQVQRQTEANERFANQVRNPIGLGEDRRFAGGGDATTYDGSGAR